MEASTRAVLIGVTTCAWIAASMLLLPHDLSRTMQCVWVGALFAAMVVVDRIYVFTARRRGPDRRSLHWSKLRNRDGDFTCAACRSVFLLPPPDLDLEAWVHCGDCGHAVAPYGEMQPHLHALARRNLPRIALRWPRFW